MVVNGQSVFLFRKPPRLRASFRIANAILHFRVIQPSESSPVKITSPVATSILPLRLDESMHQQKNKPSHRDTLSVWICIFELVSHYRVTGKKFSELVLLRRAELSMRGAPDPRSLQVDLTDRVARWLRKRKELRLLVDCIGCVRGFHIESNNAMGQPRIELNMEEDPRDNLRRKRHRHLSFPTRDPACVNGQGCCKRKLYIDFRALGWDSWIIAPVGYNANYCNGSCNSISRTPDTFSSHYSYIMDRYRRQKSNIAPACCVPTRLRAMSLIYYDRKGQLVKADVPNMIVDECGCA
ncbi:inhibin beta chain-like isoform X2 [Varroa jacobsoni]|nr:inhibin beta chain-like isoform X2 [Varroa jacobsoni]